MSRSQIEADTFFTSTARRFAVEAKPEGTLTGVDAQSAKYAARLPDNLRLGYNRQGS